MSETDTLHGSIRADLELVESAQGWEWEVTIPGLGTILTGVYHEDALEAIEAARQTWPSLRWTADPGLTRCRECHQTKMRRDKLSWLEEEAIEAQDRETWH